MRDNCLSRLVAGLAILVATSSCATQKSRQEEPAVAGLKTRIETPFLQDSIDFYTRHLGMTVLESWDDGDDKGAILGLGNSPRGEAFLEIGYAAAPGSYTGVSLQFRVRDLSAVAAGLANHWDFTGPEKRPWGSRYLYLRDPAGVQIIIYEGEL